MFSPPSDTFAAGLLAGKDGPGRPDPATVADLLAQPLVEADDPVTDALAAVDAGRISTRRVAGLLGLAVDDLAGAFAAHGVAFDPGI